MLEDYRAGASIDLLHDEADLGRRMAAPLFGAVGVEERRRHRQKPTRWRCGGIAARTCAGGQSMRVTTSSRSVRPRHSPRWRSSSRD